jgi:hypothetical protein
MMRVGAHPAQRCDALTIERDWETEGDAWTVCLDGVPMGLVVRRCYAPGPARWFWSVMLPCDLPSSLHGAAEDFGSAVAHFQVAWAMLRDWLSEEDFHLVMRYLREAATASRATSR